MPSDALTFATVHICLDAVCANNTDTRRQFNIRVPVTATMTVRQLAKETMKRLVVLARHRPVLSHTHGADVIQLAQVAQHRLAVTDVMVCPNTCRSRTRDTDDAWTSPAPVELFSCDTVCRVVALATEAVRLRLRACGPERATEEPQAVHAAVADASLGVQSSTSTIELDALPPSLPVSPPPAASQRAASLQHKRPREQHEAEEEPNTTVHTSHRKRASLSASSSSSSSESSSSSAWSRREAEAVSHLREREAARRLRWGHDAHKRFASNYVSSPQKLMKRRYTRPRHAPATSTTTTTQPSRPNPNDEDTERDDSPPALTAPANVVSGGGGGGGGGGTRLTPRRDPSHASSAMRRPPAVPAELLPDTATAVVAARQLDFEDEEDDGGHRHASREHPHTPPLTQQMMGVSTWTMWPAPARRRSSSVTTPATTTTTTTAVADEGERIVPSASTPVRLPPFAFSQPLPATFRAAHLSASSASASPSLPPSVFAAGLHTPAKPTPTGSTAATDSPLPRTPPTEPRLAVAVGPGPATTPNAVQRTLGWGQGADKFFDANTYCDDPGKAVIDDAQLHQPVRARRNKEPSPALRYIL